MREGLEMVSDADSLAQLLGGALDRRRAEAYEGRLRVMRESRLTVARVAPVDELTALASALNWPDNDPAATRGNVSCFDDCTVCHAPEELDREPVVFADRWAAAVAMGRGDAF